MCLIFIFFLADAPIDLDSWPTVIVAHEVKMAIQEVPEQQIEVQEETTAVQEVPEQQIEVHDDHQLPQLPDDPDAVNISMTQEEMAVLLPQIEDIEMDLVKLVPDDEAMMITPVDYNLVLHEEEEMTITPVEDEKVKH